MQSDIGRLVGSFRAWTEPRDGLTPNPFRLACSVDEGLAKAEITAALSNGPMVPDDMVEFWLESGSARLFKDIDYGQWGLRILRPEQSVRRTAVERRTRPDDIHATDIVVGEFLGDQELLVRACGEGSSGVLVAGPLDPRADWYFAGSTIAGFLGDYLASIGEKFWL